MKRSHYCRSAKVSVSKFYGYVKDACSCGRSVNRLPDTPRERELARAAEVYTHALPIGDAGNE